MTDLKNQKRQNVTPRLTETDLRFVEFCRELRWGKVEVVIKDGVPVMATVVRHDFRFDTG